jgi:hypothetical protein
MTYCPNCGKRHGAANGVACNACAASLAFLAKVDVKASTQERIKTRRLPYKQIVSLVVIAATGLFGSLSISLIRERWGRTSYALESTLRSQKYFSGVVIETGISMFARNPYVKISSGGIEIKCYSQQSAPIGSSITVTGNVTTWVNGAGGDLQPCAVVQ